MDYDYTIILLLILFNVIIASYCFRFLCANSNLDLIPDLHIRDEIINLAYDEEELECVIVDHPDGGQGLASIIKN